MLNFNARIRPKDSSGSQIFIYKKVLEFDIEQNADRANIDISKSGFSLNPNV